MFFFLSLWTENDAAQGVLLTNNESECFESRFVTVRIEKSPSIMLTGMADSVLGIWAAHGEGEASTFDRTLPDFK